MTISLRPRPTREPPVVVPDAELRARLEAASRCCPHCGRTQGRPLSHQRHVAACPAQRPGAVVCLTCREPCRSARALAAHWRLGHAAPPAFSCERCGFPATSAASLAAHLLTAHPAQPMPPPPPPAPRPVLTLVEPPPFRCECGGPFAEDQRQPGRCIRCTQAYERALARRQSTFYAQEQAA